MFAPQVPGFPKAELNDLSSVEALITDKTVGVMLEPVQGEGGVIPADREFMQGLRALTRKHGILLIVDEVQAGMARTGKLFAYQLSDIEPDIMTLGKGIGGGVPLAALLCTEACAVFGLPPGSKLWTCRRLRTLEGRRHSISFHAQPIEIGQKHKLQKLKSLPMYQAITEAGITVTSTSRTVEARFPPLLVARYLGVNTHEPMLVYTYVLMDKNGGNVSWLRIFVHPNERIPTEYINYQTGFWSNDQR